MSERLGELLINAGLINNQQLNEALRVQKQTNKKLGTVLVELGYTSEKKLIEFLSKQYKVQSVNLEEIEVDESLLQIIPGRLARQNTVFPVRREGKTLYLAMANPSDMFVIQDIQFTTAYNIVPLISSERSILEFINKYYPDEDDVEVDIDNLDNIDLDDIVDENIEVIKKDENEQADEVVSDLAASVDSGPIVKIVNNLITKAVEEGASDIHIEPYDQSLRIRYRIDGVLRPIDNPPKWQFRKSIVSRIKVMAHLKLQEARLPQDGRIKVKVHGKPIDIRVATVPTMYGEKVAMRILDREKVDFEFDKLGFDPDLEKKLMKSLRNPVGIILITGPTGSGKTTTLYTCLSKINSPEINITTAEDPVEFSLDGVNQLQVSESVGLTFASALRAYLRQDPNVIMVGEIRDRETAEIAIRASLTGHLVLSSVHTNSTAGTVTRLINMGVEPFLISSTVNCIVSQRLLRRICENCKVPYNISEEELKNLGFSPEEIGGSKLYKGAGCEKCGGTGYKGMVGIFEVMEITPEIRKAIMKKLTTDDLEKLAVKEGLITMREVALRKLKQGVTDILEVVKETALR
ncbi:MAG: type IV-A pilus assembly ATPase PilB [bacterium]|uniref:Type IV pilus assembly protein PilB n=2 Tax=Bacteria candidate phyla TaxID=1783234 RepID=A0A117M744_UNCT6|nr:MAG: Type IV pilus assembly protein PilB [candidate division TA06 bacterium 32_111]KUK87939.1 MAG: Type IV pilus assembly protein PilB [candidate division TA06 bacterium 34_109]MDI6700532.1 type IV-A pilus assembly ATPase PilB [bacterium]HAF08092.1 type IV-A pilus assembly ATPase PilB [candidate division WOR-3 bacterium]HCP16207.1 type IV-A pilus assembly ATPase PilB [candidate division WOR-3 bacterium]